MEEPERTEVEETLYENEEENMETFSKGDQQFNIEMKHIMDKKLNVHQSKDLVTNPAQIAEERDLEVIKIRVFID